MAVRVVFKPPGYLPGLSLIVPAGQLLCHFFVETSMKNIPSDMTESLLVSIAKKLLAFTAERVFNVN